jgi:hypothetical protein
MHSPLENTAGAKSFGRMEMTLRVASVKDDTLEENRLYRGKPLPPADIFHSRYGGPGGGFGNWRRIFSRYCGPPNARELVIHVNNDMAFYERHLVPGIFWPWAPLLIEQAALHPGQRVLDVACGTGIVARASVAGVL